MTDCCMIETICLYPKVCHLGFDWFSAAIFGQLWSRATTYLTLFCGFTLFTFVLLLLGLLWVCLGASRWGTSHVRTWSFSSVGCYCFSWTLLIKNPRRGCGCWIALLGLEAEVAKSFFMSSSTTAKVDAAYKNGCNRFWGSKKMAANCNLRANFATKPKQEIAGLACSWREPKASPVIFLVPPGSSNLDKQHLFQRCCCSNSQHLSLHPVAMNLDWDIWDHAWRASVTDPFCCHFSSPGSSVPCQTVWQTSAVNQRMNHVTCHKQQSSCMDSVFLLWASGKVNLNCDTNSLAKRHFWLRLLPSNFHCFV